MTTEKTKDEAVDMQAMMTAASEGEEITEEEEVVDDVTGGEDEGENLEPESDPDTEPNIPAEPEDNRERSELGRKVSAMWRRLDEQNETFDKLAQVLEKMSEQGERQDDSGDDERLLTAAQAKELAKNEFESLLAKREKDADQAKTAYERDYLREVSAMGEGMDQAEFDAISNVMMKDFNIRHSDNPMADAIRNFKDAQIAYINSGKRPVPKGKLPQGAKTGTTGAEKVKKKTNPLPRLDAAAQKYIDFVKRTDGSEAADKLHKSMT